MTKIAPESMNLQQTFFKMVKDRLPAAHSLADDIADILSISPDAAYRRIRGDKPISIDELFVLSNRFGISLDNLQKGTTVQEGMVTFTFRTLDNERFTLTEYFNALIHQMYKIRMSVTKEVIYAAKDLPIFHYFNYDEIAAFKIFVWKKAVMGLEEYAEKQFTFDGEDPELIKLGKESLDSYLKFPSIEIWNEETINSALRQVDFYYQSGVFKDKKDALIVAKRYLDLINHIERMAEKSYKCTVKEKIPAEPEANYQLYNNEVVLCDNTSLVNCEGHKQVFLSHNTLNFIQITHPEYCDISFKWIKNLMKRSTPISGVSERQRKQFFNGLREKAKSLCDRVK